MTPKMTTSSLPRSSGRCGTTTCGCPTGHQQGLGPAGRAAGFAARGRQRVPPRLRRPAGPGPGQRAQLDARCTSPDSRMSRTSSPNSSSISAAAPGPHPVRRRQHATSGRGGTARAVGTGLHPHQRLVPGRPGHPTSRWGQVWDQVRPAPRRSRSGWSTAPHAMPCSTTSTAMTACRSSRSAGTNSRAG